jgi:hypothetical protein
VCRSGRLLDAGPVPWQIPPPMNSDNLPPEQRDRINELRRKIEALESEMKRIKAEIHRGLWWQRGENPPQYDPSHDAPPTF